MWEEYTEIMSSDESYNVERLFGSCVRACQWSREVQNGQLPLLNIFMQ
jgi:hypothetical protein